MASAGERSGYQTRVAMCSADSESPTFVISDSCHLPKRWVRSLCLSRRCEACLYDAVGVAMLMALQRANGIDPRLDVDAWENILMGQRVENGYVGLRQGTTYSFPSFVFWLNVSPSQLA